MKQAAVLDVRQFIDEQPLSGYQLLIASLCAMVVFIDGFDAQVMGPVGPSLMAQLHIARSAFGPIVSSGTLGMMLGGLIFGPLADRFGRKPVLIACAVTFGAASLLTATAASVPQLIWRRIVAGIGMGGAMPNAIALTSEYMPSRSRNAAVMVMFCGFPFGSAFSGWTVAALISNYGWQSIFLVGGSIPIVVALLLAVLLPESIRFLIIKGGQKQRILRYVERIAPGTMVQTDVAAGAVEHSTTPFPVAQLLAEGRAALTLMLWIMFFMNLLNLWFLNNWLPTIMNDAGIHVERASLIASLFQVGGVVGTLALAGALGRSLSFAMLAATYLGAAIFIALIGNAGDSIPLLVITVFASGVGVIGGQTVANALTAGCYPTMIRSTGIGWALGIGRLGSIVGPILGGFLLSFGGSVRGVFWAAAAPALIATLAALGVSVIKKKEASDEN